MAAERATPPTVRDWENRYNGIAVVGTIEFAAQIDFCVYDELSPDELERFAAKVNAVARFAERLAWAQLKGTLKYSTDSRTRSEWDEFIADEFTDLVNYQILRETAKED